jgi:potassium-transporting ATPase KdpC subunit
VSTFARQLRPALLALAVFTVLTGLIYPLAVTVVAQTAFGRSADGSIVRVDGQAVGSELIGQSFSQPQYFHPRPSAAGEGYDAAASSGSNLGPNDSGLLAAVAERAAAYRAENGLDDSRLVPVDAVTASASGLDPMISVANARIQATRVARERGLDPTIVLAVVADQTVGRVAGVLGDPGVNVLLLNVALDDLER